MSVDRALTASLPKIVDKIMLLPATKLTEIDEIADDMTECVQILTGVTV
jgi:hypothetical protein